MILPGEDGYTSTVLQLLHNTTSYIVTVRQVGDLGERLGGAKFPGANEVQKLFYSIGTIKSPKESERNGKGQTNELWPRETRYMEVVQQALV